MCLCIFSLAGVRVLHVAVLRFSGCSSGLQRWDQLHFHFSWETSGTCHPTRRAHLPGLWRVLNSVCECDFDTQNVFMFYVFTLPRYKHIIINYCTVWSVIMWYVVYMRVKCGQICVIFTKPNQITHFISSNLIRWDIISLTNNDFSFI